MSINSPMTFWVSAKLSWDSSILLKNKYWEPWIKTNNLHFMTFKIEYKLHQFPVPEYSSNSVGPCRAQRTIMLRMTVIWNNHMETADGAECNNVLIESGHND